MNRYFAQVEYKGTNYKGFQKQKNSKQTIQQKIEFALSKVANEKISVVCAGCLLYTSPSPRDNTLSRMPSSA